ncbi:hypothetical protein [Parasitella parasitica]|uniref:Uncharacterized protein n=1 Tax=Parasitella parasitica TaxID=35722 RepID=A0A0B7N2X6_9FUNG|nr:hypothetical protein [Parasitella parasitica]
MLQRYQSQVLEKAKKNTEEGKQVQQAEDKLLNFAKCWMSTPKITLTLRRSIELATIRTKDRTAAAERRLVRGDSNDALFMGIGNAGTGIRKGSNDRRVHDFAAVLVLLFPIVHAKTSSNKTILGSARCLNPQCEAFKHGRACNNRDVMSATATGISAMTKFLYSKSFPPFTGGNHQ